jgi:hypothetical protein
MGGTRKDGMKSKDTQVAVPCRSRLTSHERRPQLLCSPPMGFFLPGVSDSPIVVDWAHSDGEFLNFLQLHAQLHPLVMCAACCMNGPGDPRKARLVLLRCF